MPLAERAGQVVMGALAMGDHTTTLQQAAAVRAAGLGGVIVMSVPDDVSSADVATLRAAGTIPLLVGVDEEGGVVQRLRAVAGAIPSEQQVAASMPVAAASAMMTAHARKVAGLGFNVVFAPVVDVLPANGTRGPIGSRSFSANPSSVSQYAAAYVAAWQAAGVLPVIKHFPGLGSATGNTDLVAATDPPLSVLAGRDLIPYRQLASSGPLGVMVGHPVVPGLTGGKPASVVPATYSYLHDTIGFNGLVFTDSLGAAAIVNLPLAAGPAAVTAIGAGADMVLMSSVTDGMTAVQALTAAAGHTLSTDRLDQAVLQVLEAKHVDPCA
jgi:beta-N-acetylhexosaminidase